MSNFQYNETLLPNTINEAIDILAVFYKNLKHQAKVLSEEDFLNRYLLSVGFFIRDAWVLYWFGFISIHGVHTGEQPELHKQFMDLDVTTSISMIEILIVLLYRRFNNYSENLTEIIDKYK